MKTTIQNMKQKKRFTLIELMVVLAIIAILMSLLLPTLGKARKKARQSVCAQQLHQIGIAAKLYSNDNEGYIMSCTDGTDSNPSVMDWQKTHLISYTNQEMGFGLYKCPSSKNVMTGGEKREGGIAFNTAVGQVWRDSGAPAKSYKYAWIPVPAETLFIGDGEDRNGQWSKAHTLTVDRTINRHFGGGNMLWIDNHVNWNSLSKLQAGKGANPEYYFEVEK